MASDFNVTAPRCLIGLWIEERCLLSENYVARVSGKADGVDTFERVMPRCRQGKGRWVSTTAQAGVDITAPHAAPAPPPRATLRARTIEAEAIAYVASLTQPPENFVHTSMSSVQFAPPPADAAAMSPALAAARAAARAEPHNAPPATAPAPTSSALARLPLSLQSRDAQIALAPVVSRLVNRLASIGSSMTELAATARSLNPAALAKESLSVATLIPPVKSEAPPVGAGDDIVLARTLRDAAHLFQHAKLANADIETVARACAPHKKGVVRATDDVQQLWVCLKSFEALEGIIL